MSNFRSPVAYHETNPDILSAALVHGLRCTSRGDKGDDPAIKQTDDFLDALRPKLLLAAGVSRDDNLYAYLCIDESVVDITDGSLVARTKFIQRSTQAVLELEIDPRRCYVSNLDTYDALKDALTHYDTPAAEKIAHSYWSSLTPLTDFTLSSIKRPELMITYDIPPHQLRHLNPTS